MPNLINPCGFKWPWQPLYAVNPYLGCPFACQYGPNGCWAAEMAHRFKRQPEDWRNVRPRFTTLDLCSDNFPWFGDQVMALPQSSILIGATCDPYPPLEKREELTLYILEVMRELQTDYPQDWPGHKILVLTKSPIVCRDWALLKEMGAWVGFSITAPAGVDTRAWEPYAPCNGSRIAALKFLHGKEIKTFASIEPIIPNLTNPMEVVRQTLGCCDYYILGSLNRSGRPVEPDYYKAQLHSWVATLRELNVPFWVKPELLALRRSENAPVG